MDLLGRRKAEAAPKVRQRLFSNHAVAAAIMTAKIALAASPTQDDSARVGLSSSTAPWAPKPDVLGRRADKKR
jgi:hypothetical protein